jgi:hypothetical protein
MPKEQGVPLDECYQRCMENAPVFKGLPGGAPKTPDEITRFGVLPVSWSPLPEEVSLVFFH